MKTELRFLDLDPEAALFSSPSDDQGPLQGMVAMVFQNERPLAGLSGILDWRFNGVISDFLLAGRIQGKPGECTYLPVQKAARTFHLILLGGGNSSAPGRRSQVPSEAILILKKNLHSLGSIPLGISRADFGAQNNAYFSSTLKGLNIAVVH